MNYHRLAKVPPKVGRAVNPALKGLPPDAISYLRHRLAGLYLAKVDADRKCCAAWAEVARVAREQGRRLPYDTPEVRAYSAAADAATLARVAYMEHEERVTYAEWFAEVTTDGDIR